ncbi:TIGR03084 family metal-binding protein [Saccharomonospora xinjiangensis]|uniref:TIGR03084 family metal-binding protein n=1 Tax=Saccharomonospora xinjiangensis TaxID=75294 RepID=UPI001070694A|nr:TIGR03084 family metal-binding protein [Saccharomonospora xinjiangensis]QBQ60229.1 mycothiol-dependent maleylpyruvate isomerase [Saccharomonospora xinjiangensis]
MADTDTAGTGGAVVAVLRDLAAESEEVDALVADLDPARWALPTPAKGWTIAHQIAHLAWTDDKALVAATEPGRFEDEIASALAAGESYVDEGAAEGAELPPDRLLGTWRRRRGQLAEALRALPEGARLPWFGPPMSAASMASARLMETWAHGQDIADALGVRRVPTARLWHVARLGVRTRDFAFAVRGLTPPAGEFRVELTGPDGATWAFGPADAAQRITGSAHHFCLLVTQRTHRADTDLRADGEQAATWLEIAQAFAGPPGPGRARAEGGPS